MPNGSTKHIMESAQYKVRTLHCKFCSVLMSAVHHNFFVHSQKTHLDFNRGSLDIAITNAIYIHLRNYVINGNEVEEKSIDCNLSSKTQIIQAIQEQQTRVDTKAFREIRNISYTFIEGTLCEFEIEINRLQLESICIYAFNKTYNELVNEQPRFYQFDRTTEFVNTKFPKEYNPFLNNLLTSLEKFDYNNSNVLLSRVIEMLTRETNKITGALDSGKYYIDAESYLDELYLLMKDCSKGFGVNVTNFNYVWEGDKGKKILLLNKNQSEGFPDINGVATKDCFGYYRIFLLESEDTANLIEEEKLILKNQLLHNVKTYCIFKNGWASIGDSKNQFDFAVLKVENCPMLMGTIFNDSSEVHSVKNGIFFTDISKAEQHFSQTIGTLLVNSNKEFIYRAKLDEQLSEVYFKENLSGADITTLNDVLKATYKKDN